MKLILVIASLIFVYSHLNVKEVFSTFYKEVLDILFTICFIYNFKDVCIYGQKKNLTVLKVTTILK